MRTSGRITTAVVCGMLFFQCWFRSKTSKLHVSILFRTQYA